MSEETRAEVLVVSDDPQLASDLDLTFPDHIEVRAVRDARSAWGAVGESAPDAVVVEIRSGNAGGFALARDMSHKAALRDVPVIMLLEREQDRWLSDQAGASETLIQPISPVDISRSVEKHLAG